MSIDMNLLILATPFILPILAVLALMVAFNFFVFSDGRIGFWRAFVRSMTVAVVAGAGLIMAGTLYINSTVPKVIEAQRSPHLVEVIESASTIKSGWTGKGSEFPLMDIAAGKNDLKSQPVRDALNSGQTVKLQTGTGKPAEVRLASIGGKGVQAVISYDGEIVQDERLIFSEYQPKASPLFPLLTEPTPLPKA